MHNAHYIGVCACAIQVANRQVASKSCSVVGMDRRCHYSRACKKAKVTQRIYHHLFRHSFGTHATVAGVGLKHLQDIMGHSTSKTTELYTHLAAERLTEESKKFARYIDEQEKPKPRKTKGKSKP